MVPVRTAAASLGHGVALAPDDLPTEQVAEITQSDGEPVGYGKQVAVAEPRHRSIYEGPAFRAGLYVCCIFRRETALVST